MISPNEDLPASTPPLCKDCRYRDAYPSKDVDTRLLLSRCIRSKRTMNLVSGISSHALCSNEREDTGMCGPGGEYFEPTI